MKLSVFATILGDKPCHEAMRWLAEHEVQAVEIGCGGYVGKGHCDPAELLNDANKLSDFRSIFQSNHLEIAALSCHGNPVHPDADVAAAFDEDFRNAILLAERIGVKRVVGFSGCPGGSADDRTPNWVTCAWPNDYQRILEYQWNEVLIPYWQTMAVFAAAHGVEKIALEMHPGFCVYNPATLLRLRAAVGPIIGANFDPSHLFWQQINPVAAIAALGDAIHFVHAKDTQIDPVHCPVNGVLETQSGNPPTRSWCFRTVGYGHDRIVWNDIVSALKRVGYDDVVSIEHEDPLMPPEQGLTKAIAFLKDVLL